MQLCIVMRVTASPGASFSSSRSVSSVRSSRNVLQPVGGLAGRAVVNGCTRISFRLRTRASATSGFFSRAAQVGDVADLLDEFFGPKLAGKGPSWACSTWRLSLDRARQRPGCSCGYWAGNWSRTSVCFMAAKTEHCCAWLAARSRSIVTSLRPRAGTLAMRKQANVVLRVDKRLASKPENP